MDGICALASSSVSSLYGNVNCAIRELIISKFPRNYFKYIASSTEIASHNMRRQFGGNNSRNEISVRTYPQLIIQPSYQDPDPDGFMQGIPLTKNIDDLQFYADGRYLMDILYDREDNYRLKFRINRDRIEFEVKLIMPTLHSQLDIYKMMTNQIVWDRPYARPTALEAVIPKSIIYEIGRITRLDVYRNPKMVPMLLSRLNRFSYYPITYKLRNASATDEYYMYYMHQMIITFSDLRIIEGSKKSMVDDHYDIEFKVTADFNLPGLFTIIGDTTKIVNSSVDMTVSYEDNVGVEYVPLFSIDNIYAKYPPEVDGMQILGSTRFVCDKKKKGEADTLDISSIFTEDQMKIIHFYNDYDMNVSTLVRLYLLKNNTELNPMFDYHMNWYKMEVSIPDPDPDATYRLIVYRDQGKINDILASLIESNFSDKKSSESVKTKDDHLICPNYDETEISESLRKSVQLWARIITNTEIINRSDLLEYE